MANFNDTVAKVFPVEGGFQADPADNANYCGGQLIGTNRGISAIAYSGFYGSCPSVAAIKALTREMATAIYKKNYWSLINGDKVKNQSVAEMMFQYVIGSGQGEISEIKEVANNTIGKKVLIENDKPISDVEIKIMNGLDQEKFYNNLWQFRKKRFENIAAADPEKQKFLKGWLNRLNTMQYDAGSTDGKFIASIVTGAISFFAFGWIKLPLPVRFVLAFMLAVAAWVSYDTVKQRINLLKLKI